MYTIVIIDYLLCYDTNYVSLFLISLILNPSHLLQVSVIAKISKEGRK